MIGRRRARAVPRRAPARGPRRGRLGRRRPPNWGRPRAGHAIEPRRRAATRDGRQPERRLVDAVAAGEDMGANHLVFIGPGAAAAREENAHVVPVAKKKKPPSRRGRRESYARHSCRNYNAQLRRMFAMSDR